MKKFDNPEILIELLKMRSIPEDQAKVAAGLFAELIGNDWPQQRTGEPVTLEAQVREPDETLNDFIRELLERALLLPVQMFLERLPEEQRERLRQKIVL